MHFQDESRSHLGHSTSTSTQRNGVGSDNQDAVDCYAHYNEEDDASYDVESEDDGYDTQDNVDDDDDAHHPYPHHHQATFLRSDTLDQDGGKDESDYVNHHVNPSLVISINSKVYARNSA